MSFLSTLILPLAQLSDPIVGQTTRSAAKPSTWDNSTWLAMAFALVATVYILAKSRKKQKDDPLARPPQTIGVSQQRAVERDMQNLLVELSEMSRQIGAHLDTRSRKLELLIDEADKRIAQLSAIGASKSDGAYTPRFDAQVPNGSPPEAASEPPPQLAVDPRHLEIYHLADGGQTAFQIADRLGRPKGEIELILALRPRTE